MKSFVRLITEVGFFVEEIMKKSNKLRNFFTELLLYLFRWCFYTTKKKIKKNCYILVNTRKFVKAKLPVIHGGVLWRESDFLLCSFMLSGAGN